MKFRLPVAGHVNHFSKSQELVIYRIMMELTSNAIRHSQASEVEVQLNSRI